MIKTKKIYKRNKLGQFAKAPSWTGPTRRMLFKFVALALVVSMNGLALSRVGDTMGYYNDEESSGGNVFDAGMLDFVLSESHYESIIGPEAVGEKTAVTVA